MNWRIACIVVTFALLFQSASCLPSITDLWSSLWGGAPDTDTESAPGREKRQSTGEGDSNPAIHLSSNDNLPRFSNGSINFDFLPTLSNGHLGFTPFSDCIFVNGLYNGRGGETHRAKIPALVMGWITIGTPSEERRYRTTRDFTLNAETGVFEVTIKSDLLYVVQRLYVHQKYDKLFVQDIYAEAKSNQEGISGGDISLEFPPDIRDTDLTGFVETVFRQDKVVTARTKVAEEGTDTQTVSYIYTEPETKIRVRSVHDTVRITHVMSIDKDKSRAQNDIQEALAIVYGPEGGQKLLEEHEHAWHMTWARGRLETIGNGNRIVSKLIKSAQYYILSNLPAYEPNQPPQQKDFLYGVGRQSLGKGAKDKNQQGHIFWDSEVYVLPAILPTHPELAKKILEYRPAFIPEAEQYAEATGYKGYRFPWESAFTGRDVTPEGTCDGCRKRQIHVGAGISWAIRQYFSLTRNQDYLKNEEYRGCDMAINIAKFYSNAAKYSTFDGRYHIKDVMGPDDFHDHVNNNAYTNAAASLAIHWGRYMQCMCGRQSTDEIKEEDIGRALHMYLPYDYSAKIHYQYQGYKDGGNDTVKQADAVLLGYPLHWNMSWDIMKNDLFYYHDLLSDRTPAMTHSFMMVGWKYVKEEARARSYFETSYRDYVIQPYKVWREYRDGGTVNFLPGMGAFLQSIIYGYAGLRIRPEQLEFHDPDVPDGLEGLRFHGFHYLGANLTITIYRSPQRSVHIKLEKIGDYPLVLVRNYTHGKGNTESINEGETLIVNNAEQGFYIYSTRGTSCNHPQDYIFMPWGYSPFVNGGEHLSSLPYFPGLLSLLTGILLRFS